MFGHAARALVLLLPLATSQPGEPREPTLEVTPDAIPLAGGALRLRLSPPAKDPDSVWVGLTFRRLVRLPTITDPSEPQRRFCADIPALDRAFPEAPREGDQILLVVYAGTRPLAGPQALRVAPDEPNRRTLPCLASLSKGHRS